jgi:predicted phage terminase large subunit-like protein
MTLTGQQQRAAEALLDFVGPLRLRHCPLQPAPRQEAFLRLSHREVLYGGAAGGGKSVALLMAALQYSDVPGYHALLLRPCLTEFELPGGLIELAHEWLDGSEAHWSGENRSWHFRGPGRNGTGGASMRFGYLDGAKDATRYAGSSFSFIGFDELVRFEETEYRRVFRMLRGPKEASGAAPDGTTIAVVPQRVRATSNPGGPNHNWVKTYFVDEATRPDDVLFMPSRIGDNRYLNREAYEAALEKLPRVERERLLNGDWEVPDEGDVFQRHWLQIVDRTALPAPLDAVRFWDLAATEPTPNRPDPDWTVGLKLERHEPSGMFYVTSIVRARKAAGGIEQLVAATAAQDGRGVGIVIEQEPGSAGVSVADRYKRHVLAGFDVRTERATGAKDVRARVVAAAAETGLLRIVSGPNTNEFLDEVCSFPNARHDDCVDALAGAHAALSARRKIVMRMHVPRGRIPTAADRFGFGFPTGRSAAERTAARLGIPQYIPPY